MRKRYRLFLIIGTIVAGLQAGGCIHARKETNAFDFAYTDKSNGNPGCILEATWKSFEGKTQSHRVLAENFNGKKIVEVKLGYNNQYTDDFHLMIDTGYIWICRAYPNANGQIDSVRSIRELLSFKDTTSWYSANGTFLGGYSMKLVGKTNVGNEMFFHFEIKPTPSKSGQHAMDSFRYKKIIIDRNFLIYKIIAEDACFNYMWERKGSVLYLKDKKIKLL